MSTLIEVGYTPGRLIYAVLHANGQVWNNTAHAFENYDSGNWTDYAVNLAEQTGSGYYSATYPSQISAGVLTTDLVYQMATASPALGDTLISIGQSRGVNLYNINGSGNGVAQFGISTESEVQGTAQTGTLSTTEMTTTLTSTLANAYQGRTIIWTSGQLLNCAASIIQYTVLNGKLRFTPVPVAPSNGDTFIII